jgi:hypothetical protein
MRSVGPPWQSAGAGLPQASARCVASIHLSRSKCSGPHTAHPPTAPCLVPHLGAARIHYPLPLKEGRVLRGSTEEGSRLQRADGRGRAAGRAWKAPIESTSSCTRVAAGAGCLGARRQVHEGLIKRNSSKRYTQNNAATGSPQQLTHPFLCRPVSTVRMALPGLSSPSACRGTPGAGRAECRALAGRAVGSSMMPGQHGQNSMASLA